MIPWYESRMLAARARVPFACMIWQVVPSTSTRKSINLDLARAARYWYFTKNRPAHADQNSDQSSSSRQSSCCTCWAWHRVRMDTKSPGRSACSGPAPHTHTQARHTHTHTHTHSLSLTHTHKPEAHPRTLSLYHSPSLLRLPLPLMPSSLRD